MHGVAVRNTETAADNDASSTLFDHLLQDIAWPVIEAKLRLFVAPALSLHPESVTLLRAYWGDLGAHMAWNGASYLSKDAANHLDPSHLLNSLFRSQIAADIRPPLNNIIALFVGDIFCYLSRRGTAEAPGPIPTRVLETLLEAHAIKEKANEPLVVLSNSMGCEIMYDIVTSFLPGSPKYSHIKVDFWCGVASQVGLFEELKLFLASSEEYGSHRMNRVPFPDRNHLGSWWNVWDDEDVLSYSVRDIIDDVDDSKFVVGKNLLNEHLGYLQEDRFYLALAEWIEGKKEKSELINSSPR